MPNGASVTRSDRDIRAAMTDDGVVEAVISLPSRLCESGSIGMTGKNSPGVSNLHPDD
jgi:hypothetical protein